MFIRRVKTRTTASGTHYYSYRLVDSQRFGGRVQQRTLLNLGNGFSVPQEHWKALSLRIKAIILGEINPLIPPPDGVEHSAQYIATLLLQKYSKEELLFIPAKPYCNPAQESQNSTLNQQEAKDYRQVDINSLELFNSRSVGGEAVALNALKQVKLDEKLKELGFNQKQIYAAIGNIIGRMIQPGSELSTHRWLQEHSALGELLACDYGQQSLSSLYRASDLLWQKHDEIEHYLYRQHDELFETEQTITLYDLTNTFFEGTGKHNDHAAYGRSKEKRSDCPLVTLALVLDSNGFSRHSRIFAGNISEASTLQKMLNDLQSPEDEAPIEKQPSQLTLNTDKHPTVVMDAGIATEENIEWLKEHGYPYIVVSRKRHLEFDEKNAVTVKETRNNTVRTMRIECDNGEVELYCHSVARENKENAINQRQSSRLEHELDQLANGLLKPRKLKSAKKVCEKIGRLRQKYSRTAKYYQITTELDNKGKNVIALDYKKIAIEDDSASNPGVYCLRSSHQDWNEERLWHTYTLLTDLEAVFRSLKSELGMRPVYHQKTHRVEGHLFITLLAYNLVHQIRLKLKAEGINDSWETIRTTLHSQVRVTTSISAENGDQIHIRKSNYPNASQLKLLQALKMGWKHGETQTTTVKSSNRM